MIFKCTKLMLLALVLSTRALFSDLVYGQDATVHTLLTTYFCNGDSHGEFVNDFVAVLSDGSAWKVHPNDAAVYSQWTNTDVVHVQVRTSFYWFKREHKFEMQNLSRNQSVKVMLMQYPMTALSIVTINSADIGGYEVRSYYNASGETIYETIWVPKNVVDLFLNDGTVWRLKGINQGFEIGNYVYFSIHREIDKAWPFLIKGTQREAYWQKVERVL